MTWTAALIIIPGVCYGLAAALYANQGNYPLAITYSGYLLGNCGLLLLDLAQAR